MDGLIKAAVVGIPSIDVIHVRVCTVFTYLYTGRAVMTEIHIHGRGIRDTRIGYDTSNDIKGTQGGVNDKSTFTHHSETGGYRGLLEG
jgi:hypothetical protein